MSDHIDGPRMSFQRVVRMRFSRMRSTIRSSSAERKWLVWAKLSNLRRPTRKYVTCRFDALEPGTADRRPTQRGTCTLPRWTDACGLLPGLRPRLCWRAQTGVKDVRL
jgi:hypothetical protein